MTARIKGRRTQVGPFELPLDATIVVRRDCNPKRPGSKSAARFELYRGGESVEDHINASMAAGNTAGLAKADLMWDWNHGFIEISAYNFDLLPLGASMHGRIPSGGRTDPRSQLNHDERQEEYPQLSTLILPAAR